MHLFQSKTDGTSVTSNTRPAATFDKTKDRLILLTTEDDPVRTDRLRIWTLRSTGTNAWAVEDSRWLDDGNARTIHTPTIVFDRRTGAGSRYLVSYRRLSPNPYGHLQLLKVLSTTPTGLAADDPFPYRSKLLINTWTFSRHSPLLISHGDEILLAWQMHRQDVGHRHHNKLAVVGGAAGEQDTGLTDQNDILFLLTHGLRESLAPIR